MENLQYVHSIYNTYLLFVVVLVLSLKTLTLAFQGFYFTLYKTI